MLILDSICGRPTVEPLFVKHNKVWPDLACDAGVNGSMIGVRSNEHNRMLHKSELLCIIPNYACCVLGFGVAVLKKCSSWKTIFVHPLWRQWGCAKFIAQGDVHKLIFACWAYHGMCEHLPTPTTTTALFSLDPTHLFDPQLYPPPHQ